jgi:poly(A) polymerase
MAKPVLNQSAPFAHWFGGKTLPPYARAILNARGAELFVVGGAVRDALLGRKEKRDLDLLVRGTPIVKLINLLKRFGSVSEVGRTFGVIKFVPRGQKGSEAIDIALPRIDFSFGTGGYKDVEARSRHTLALERDLERRDFTVNAMAWDLGRCRLIDPFKGERDLSKKILRSVGEPSKRFCEDYTRLLRLLRFSIELDFKIHGPTWREAKRLMPRLLDRRAHNWVVPRELVGKELLKAMLANPGRAFDLFDQAGVWRVLVPEIEKMKGVPQPPQFHSEGDVFEHTRLALLELTRPAFKKRFPEGFDAETAIAVMLHDIGKPPTLQTPERHGTDRIRFNGHDREGAAMTRNIAERLALSAYKAPGIDVSIDRLGWVIAHHLLMVHADAEELRPRTIEKYFLSGQNPGGLLRRVMFCDIAATLNENGKPFWKSLNDLERRIGAVAALAKKTGQLPNPFLDGNAIMRLTKTKPGPAVGDLIAKLRDAQLSGTVKNARQAEVFIKKIVKSHARVVGAPRSKR